MAFDPGVRTYAGVPPQGVFNSTSGTPLVINTLTDTAYYLKVNTPTPLAGGGGGFANPMTTLGDIIVGGVAGVPTRYGATTDGFVLTLAAGIPAWAAPTGGTGLTRGDMEARLTLAAFL